LFVDIIIPCFNEDKNITQLVNSWLEIIERNLNFNVYFINNGSTDNTKQEIINNISLSNNKRLHVIDVPH
jgi:glycosyltransferase involved in cell wall biosynthesis